VQSGCFRGDAGTDINFAAAQVSAIDKRRTVGCKLRHKGVPAGGSYLSAGPIAAKSGLQLTGFPYTGEEASMSIKGMQFRLHVPLKSAVAAFMALGLAGCATGLTCECGADAGRAVTPLQCSGRWLPAGG
jgi:hypothetical protein